MSVLQAATIHSTGHLSSSIRMLCDPVAKWTDNGNLSARQTVSKHTSAKFALVFTSKSRAKSQQGSNQASAQC